MRNPFLLLSSLFLLLFFSACHRPYAVVQRTPAPLFSSPPAVLPTDSVALAHTEKVTTDASLTMPDETKSKSVDEFVVASTHSSAHEAATHSVARRVQRIESMLASSAKTITEQPRPRPKPKNQLRLGNRIRQSLGLPLREELNWWQRIDWKLKASVFVIGIAILFAILNLGQLALLFGLIGAVLLVLGLKRSFKKRRPWL